MKRMLFAALASSVLVLVAPAVASAHHGHHHRGLARTHKHHARSARLERFGVASVSGTPRAGFTVTQSSPENEPAGTIASFEGGVLKIKLGDGSIVSGKVTEDTELRCRSATPPGDDEDDQGDDDGGGSQGDEQGSSGGQFASQHGDFLAHDQRYDRTEEFLAVCNLFWQSKDEVNFQGRYYQVAKGKLNTPFCSEDRDFPELYVAGNSASAERVALSQGTCWMRFPEAPEDLEKKIQPALESGKEVGLRLSMIARPTREEAIGAAQALLPDEDIGKEERGILSRSDSQTLKQALAAADNVGWLNGNLWAGLVPYYGSSAITLLGPPQELAEIFIEYKRIGITQFIIAGWPKLDEMIIFGREVLPGVRRLEQRQENP